VTKIEVSTLPDGSFQVTLDSFGFKLPKIYGEKLQTVLIEMIENHLNPDWCISKQDEPTNSLA